MGRSGVGTDVRTSFRALHGAVRRFYPLRMEYGVERGCMGFWRRYCVYSPSEGVRKMRESVSPSEGGKGLLGGGTRQYGALEVVLRLLTFGRCAKNAGKCLTFGRWERSAGRWNAAVWGSGGGTAFTHLRKVCGKCGKVSHLRKVGKICWEVERGCMGLWRWYCVYSPSEGVRKMRESVSPPEGGMQWGKTEARTQAGITSVLTAR